MNDQPIWFAFTAKCLLCFLLQNIWTFNCSTPHTPISNRVATALPPSMQHEKKNTQKSIVTPYNIVRTPS